MTNPLTGDTPGGDTRAARERAGKALRGATPRSAQSQWTSPKRGRDPVAMVLAADRGRIPFLVPLRHERMLASPFAFLRGAANIMAADLARTPSTGIIVQACGDCHLLNFGAFATPERRVIFDINDFDETYPAPWEWDIKRLAASVMVAGRYRGFGESQCRDAVLQAVGSYRSHMTAYAGLGELEVWYARIDAESLLSPKDGVAAVAKKGAKSPDVPANMSARLLPKLTEMVEGRRRIKDDPPLVFHPAQQRAFLAHVRRAIEQYRRSVPPDRRALLARYAVVDAAVKVVGVGSVGTLAAVVLLQADMDDVLFLQVKQARTSVLQPFVPQVRYASEGQRVVVGQRLMQSASDMFLGWSRMGRPAIDVYFRQLRDMKVSINLDTLPREGFMGYVDYCGWAVARAHAKSGQAAAIAGYLGTTTQFDVALARFAAAYADQTEADHAALRKAAKAGRVTTG